jgi:protein TonB
MNKFIISLSFLIVLLLHLFLFFYYKNHQVYKTQSTNTKNLIEINLSKVNFEKNIEEKKEPMIEPIKEKKLEKKQEPIVKKVENTKPQITPNIEENKVETTKIEEPKEIIQSNQVNFTENQKDNLEEQKLIDEYGIKLREEISKNKIYPNISKKLKEQGIVIVNFKVNKSGVFFDIKLVTSSNKTRLDESAINTIIETKKFKPYNQNIKKEFLEYNLPLEYKIN